MTSTRAAVVMLLAALVISCASALTLSDRAKSLRDGMTAESAAATLARHAKPGSGRHGACVVGVEGRFYLDRGQPLGTAGAVISFTAWYPVMTGASVSGSVMGGTGTLTTSYQMRRAKFSVDARTLTKIRVHEADGEFVKRLARWCPDLGPGYLVDLSTAESLPDNGGLSINVPDRDALDSLLATLVYFSPQARLMQGTGF